eukprot:GCRY01003618.1.p1 GENE.GCRY01003618.1~~GCRY01003618.1.p1  ORF type:complete len:896 (+),score=357.46 GCRY01003618.1:142-2829(+)
MADTGGQGASDTGGGNGGEGGKEITSVFDATGFEELEKQFQTVLTELVGDKSMEKFRQEYEKLHQALKKSHDSEKRLMRKCRDLNEEIVQNMVKVQTAIKLSQEDQQTISSLKKEIEKAWKMVESANEKETKAKETIAQLKEEIENLSRLVEQGAGLTVGQEHSVHELMKVKEELTKERDHHLHQNTELRKELADQLEKIRALEGQTSTLDNEIHQLTDTIATMKTESNRATKKKEKLEKDLKENSVLLKQRQEEIQMRKQEIAQGEEQILKLQQEIKEAKNHSLHAAKEYDALVLKLQKLQQDMEEQIHTNMQLSAESGQRQVEIKVKEDEIAALKQEQMKANRIREGLLKKQKTLEEQKIEVEKEREALRTEIAQMEREAEAQKRKAEQDGKQIEDLLREKNILNKNLQKSAGSTQKQQDLVKIAENTRRNLETEISSYKVEAQKQRKLIYQLEKEREKYSAEAAEATQKYLQALEEVKIREMTVFDLNKKIAEADTKLKQQQNLYETVRSERNLYSKNLIESQDEIAEMKRKFKIMNHQIEQLKEEITAKDHALVKEHFEHMKVEKEKESLRNELTRIKQQIDMADKTIKGQRLEIQKLNHIINEADSERARQKKEYDTVIAERDILGGQLLRRNDELALLYEKIKVQQSILSKGEAQYRERMEDIRVLKTKIADLKREIHVMKTSITHTENLSNEVFHLKNELIQEKTKVKALSEELETPMNIHRWRKLEGSDPTTYEMVQKIQTLQKRLIAKTEEVVEKDVQIQEKEKMYMELKNMLARQPGPEVGEQLNIYQQQIKDKTRQLKTMAAELNMFQTQTQEYKYEIERLNADLETVKKQYFEKKRREQLRKDRERAEKQNGIIYRQAPKGPRYAGGGYQISAGQPLEETDNN